MNILSRTEAERHLQLPSGSGSDFLDAMIALVGAKFARATGREDWGESTERTEYHDGGSKYIFPKYWPITSYTIYDDINHDWAADSVLDSDDIFANNDLGILTMEAGIFSPGDRNLKLVYTAGYSSESDIPAVIKSAGLLQLETEYNKRKRAGPRPPTFQALNDNESEIIPEASAMLARYTRRIPFVC